MNALFICSKNKLRSPTAEHVARQMGVEADSAGLAPEAIQVLHPDQLRWADTIFVMEARHKSKLTQKYSKYLKDKKIITLGILDNYDYMQPELIEILEQRLPQFLKIEKPKFKIK
jgi:predicted protein tyrosine phosphatase